MRERERELSEQEKFWIGDFGDQYLARNTLARAASRQINLERRILRPNSVNPDSILEFGCNIGINLVALARLFPQARLTGYEINQGAARQCEANLAALCQKDMYKISNKSLFDADEKSHDFVLSSGLLIHIAPELLPLAYRKIYEAASKYICMMEYYNPTPLEVEYRGNRGKLWKRDFAGEFMRMYSDVKLVDYGFIWRNDPVSPEDDATWFLMEKHGS